MSPAPKPVEMAPTAFFKTVFENAPVPLLSTDADGRIAVANDAARRLTGRDEADLSGAPLSMLFVVAEGGPAKPEPGVRHAELIAADGAKKAVTLRIRAVEFAGEKRKVISIEDRAPAAAENTRGGSFDGGFLAGVGHDLRTPLNVVFGYAQMLREGAGDVVSAAEIGEHIQDAAQTLLASVDDLIELALLEQDGAVKPDWVDPLEIVNAAVRGVRAEAKLRGVRVTGDLANAPTRLWCDERATRRLVSALLHDAVRRSRRDGEATLAIAPRDHGGCELIIRDDGAAPTRATVRAALAPGEIGDRFERSVAQTAGRRLGLPIADALARLHGGELSIETGRGRGVVIRVILPGAPDEG